MMREQWGCTYFRLDANFWGAVHGSHLYDPKATRIEAYRRGMEAVRRGAGEAFLLGCNHPIWPSLGLIDGSRSSGDISRKWERIASCMEESMQRNWQNGRLWWNDPDAVLLTDRTAGAMQGTLTEEEFRFHATSACASGGMMLSGDDLTAIPAARLEMLRKLLPPTGIGAVFDDPSTLEVARIRLPSATRIAVFNRGETARIVAVPLGRGYEISEVWTSEKLGDHKGEYRNRGSGTWRTAAALCGDNIGTGESDAGTGRVVEPAWCVEAWPAGTGGNWRSDTWVYGKGAGNNCVGGAYASSKTQDIKPGR